MNEMLADKLSNFSRAWARLDEALREKGHALSRDGAIQRFEFTFETGWKALRKFLLVEGHECASPRDCLKKAFQCGYVDHEEVWLNMLKDRNLSSHLHEEAEAGRIYENIGTKYSPELKKLQEVLRRKIETL